MPADYASLMARYQAGDPLAFDALCRHVARELPSLVQSLAPGLPCDEAIVTDIVLEMHRARRSYDPRHAFEPWLNAVTRHAIGRRTRPRRRLLAGIRARLAAGRPPRPRAAA